MSMLHDANKRLIKVSDIYPEFAELQKGDYTIRLQLRHDDAALLDKMKDMPVVVERKLKEAVSVPVYATNRDAVKGGKPVKERALHPGKSQTHRHFRGGFEGEAGMLCVLRCAVLCCAVSSLECSDSQGALRYCCALRFQSCSNLCAL